MPGSTIDVAIELIIPDNTAFTTLRALQALGYSELEHVHRADYLGLLTSPGAPGSEEVVHALSRAEVVFNPNKHRLLYASADRPPSERPAEWEALVTDLEPEDERLRKLLVTTFRMPYLETVSRGVVWHLSERAAPASHERTLWACDALLANPVSQRYQVRPRPQRIAFREQLASAANERP